MAKKKKKTIFSRNYGMLCSFCRSFLDAKIDEDFESMKDLAELIIGYDYFEESVKKDILKRQGIFPYDLEEAINYSPLKDEENEDTLATALEEYSDLIQSTE